MYLVLGALCNATVGIFESFHHWPLYESFYRTLGVPLPDLSAALSIRGGFMQAQGALANPATLSLLTGFAIIPCVALKDRFNPAGRWLLIAVLAAGMISAASRGGWVAAGAALALYWLYTRRLTQFTLFGGAAFVGWVVMVFLLPKTGRIGDLLGRSGHAQETAEYRSTLLNRGLEEVRAHPLAGQTLDQLQVSMDDMRQGQHIIDFVNTHLYMALTLGIGGLLIWLIAWAIPIGAAWNARAKHGTRVTHAPVAVPFAILGAVFVALAFTSTIDRMLPWASDELRHGLRFHRDQQSAACGGGRANGKGSGRAAQIGISVPRRPGKRTLSQIVIAIRSCRYRLSQVFKVKGPAK